MIETSRVTSAELVGEPIGPLDYPSLPSLLIRAAAMPDAGQIVHIDLNGEIDRYSYSDLLDDARRILSGLRFKGIKELDRVVLQIREPRDLLAIFWACQLGGMVPVPASANPPANSGLSPKGLLESVLKIADTEWSITNVDTVRLDRLETEFAISSPSEPAALLLTSGSTGLPKAVTLTHHNIVSRCEGTARARDLTKRNRTFNWMPLDHVGGLVMFHIRDVFLACHQVHADMRWVLEDPLRWLDVISEHRCDTTWASNFAFGLVVGRRADVRQRSWDLTQLKYIMNGGEPVKPRVAQQFLDVLAPFGIPQTAIHPGWGMSETSSGVVDTVFAPGPVSEFERFTPLGRPHPGVRVRVVDESGTMLGEREVGRLQVAGDPVSAGYFGNDRQSKLSFTSDGWFKTGDLAFIADGQLTVTGRVHDIIESDGVAFYGHEIEAAVEELQFVEPSFTVACLVAAELAIVYCPRSRGAEAAEADEIRRHVLKLFGLTVKEVRAMEKSYIPKTGIGKLKRAQLALQLEHSPDAMDLCVLQAIRLKGRPMLHDVVAAIAADADTVIAALVARGLCGEADGRYSVTAAGRDRLTDLLGKERTRIDQSRILDLYKSFDVYNTELKQIITNWQLTDGLTPNSHEDKQYDAAVILRLEDLHATSLPLLGEFVELVPRLHPYIVRLDAALTRIHAGDHRWLAGPLIDSFHTVWFEFHEELIGLAGRTRAAEAKAGRAV